MSKKNKIVIVETSDAIESEARDVAESKLTASKEQLRGVKGFFQKIWKHNLFHEYYRQKEIHKAKNEITTKENIFANTNADKTAHNEAMKSIVTRFASDYDETIHKEAGEKRETLRNEGLEGEIKAEIKNTIISFAQGNIDESIFIEEKNRIFSKIKGQKKDVIDKGAMYADNLLEVARQVKQNIEHGQRIEDLDLDFDIVLGKAKAGVRTEAQFNLCDKIIHKITNTSIGRFVNETTVASAVAIGYSIATAASQRLANSSLFAWGSFGATAVLGAGIAGMREGKRLEEERRQHFRDMAKGKNFNPDEAPRRKQMEEFRYETVSASILINNLNNEISRLSPANLEATLGHLAEIEARIKLSDTKKIDLISFSDEEKVEKERLNLDIARAQAKVAIKKFVADNAIPLPENMSFEDYLMKITETRSLDLTGGDTGIEKRNAIFRKMKTKKVAWAAFKGLATGLVIGGISQEIGAFFKADQQGFVEGLIKGHQAPIGPVHHLTPLEYLRAYLAGDLNKIPTPSGFHEVLIGTNHIKLPNGVDLVKNTDGSYDLMHGKDFITKHLDFNKDGTLTEQAKNSLIKYGIPVHGSVQTITHQTTENITSNTPEYIKRHPELFNKIHRDLWYDNDTPAPVFDKNELGLWWGGNGNSGIDTHGNYVFNIKNMSSWGSYHDSFSVNAQDAMKSGKLVMMLSLSDGTQNMAVPVPIDINGNAIINPNSAIGKMFFSTVDGHALFKGKFAEVAQVLGVDKAGEKSLRILATHVGDGVNSVPDTLVKNIVEHIPRTALDIRFPAEQHALDAPWVIPVFGREPLEPTEISRFNYFRYLGTDAEENELYRKRRSSKLDKDPDAELDPQEEIERYLNNLDKEWLKELDELNKQIIEPMHENCEAVICIPAAGHQEGKNIYTTLDWYKKQETLEGKKLDPSKFEILVLVNHPHDQEPDETIDEIKRFKKDNPELKVNIVYKVFESKPNIGHIRKLASDLTLKRQILRKNKNDIIIISNDADCRGINKKYLDNFFNIFSNNSKLDAVLGKIDWDPEAYSKSPIFHLGTRFFQYLDAVRRHPKKGIPVEIGSSGANFAYKASIYAAVGGYNEGNEIGEDVVLGRMMKAARGNSEKCIAYGKHNSMVYTNARRGMKAVQEGFSPAEQWSKIKFSANDDVRKLGWIDKDKTDFDKELDNPDYIKHLKFRLEDMIDRTLREYKISPSSLAAKRAIRFLINPPMMGEKGLSASNFSIVNKNIIDAKGNSNTYQGIEIKDMKPIIKWLKNYQKDWKKVIKNQIE